MIVLGFDLETTGLEKETDAVIELGYALWDTDSCLPMLMRNMLLKTDVPISESASETNHIEKSHLDKFGIKAITALSRFVSDVKEFSPEYYVAHNGIFFDSPFLKTFAKRNGIDIPVLPLIDTMWDLPIKNPPPQRSLLHYAAHHGFINPFPHRALTDTLTMLKLLGNYAIEDIIAKQKEPMVVVCADPRFITFERKHLAKEKKFSWENISSLNFPKRWVKLIRESDFENEEKKCGFSIQKLQTLDRQ